MKFVLIVLISMSGRPAMTTAIFDDKLACEAAAAMVKSWEADARVLRAECLPAGHVARR